MGRTLKRVPMDFDWQINKVWEGYINPHYKKCPHCDHGYSHTYDRVAKHLNSLFYDNNALKDKQYSQITTFLCGKEHRAPLGHDSHDAYVGITKLGELAGLKKGWEKCTFCNGSGISLENKKAYDEWIEHEPPVGAGYQIWENTMEGSPQSPVFKTLDELAEWCAKNATAFADVKAHKED